MSTILYGRQLPSDLIEIIRGSFQETAQKDALSPGNKNVVILLKFNVLLLIFNVFLNLKKLH
jgi:hypothetical protein